jgi:hypothetical protein
VSLVSFDQIVNPQASQSDVGTLLLTQCASTNLYIL